MAENILRLSDQGRRLYEKRRTQHPACNHARSDDAARRRLYVDGKQLRRARSSYVERADHLRADVLI